MPGFSLIEVLIATFILAATLLGVASLETFTLQNSYTSYLNSVAVTRILNLSERFQAKVGTKEFSIWNQENPIYLPHGQASLSGGSITGYKVTLCWGAHNTARNVTTWLGE